MAQGGPPRAGDKKVEAGEGRVRVTRKGGTPKVLIPGGNEKEEEDATLPLRRGGKTEEISPWESSGGEERMSRAKKKERADGKRQRGGRERTGGQEGGKLRHFVHLVTSESNTPRHGGTYRRG